MNNVTDIWKPKISLVVGHSYNDQGAILVQTEKTKRFEPKTEYQYNIELSHHIVDVLSPNFSVFVVFRDGLGIEKTYDELEKWNPSINIELHFNGSSQTKAFGTEVLVEPKWAEFGILMQSELCRALGRDHNGDRGIKRISNNTERGYQSLRRLKCPDVIIEPFFGSNESDALLGLNSMPEIARAISMGISKWFARGEIHDPDILRKT